MTIWHWGRRPLLTEEAHGAGPGLLHAVFDAVLREKEGEVEAQFLFAFPRGRRGEKESVRLVRLSGRGRRSCRRGS